MAAAALTSRLAVHCGAILVVALGSMLTGACAGADAVDSAAPLRIGTTGNAPPYTQRVGNSFVGCDIDLAHDLGASMGRSVEFVHTTWPSLVSDLVAGRYDIAMGAIYVTPERAQAGVFSDAYLYVGQLAIVRCNEVARFRTLADANRIGVKVLSTLGGTNHEFIQDHLPDATFVPIDSDPREIARLIAAGQGDISFVTSLGAQYYVRHDPRLCIGLGGVLISENLGIAVLMPQDSPLLGPVNHWVRARLRDGLIERVVQAHLEP